MQQFVKNFEGKYPEPPDGLAALGYDAARILADAMERAPSLKPSDIRKALADTKDFPGVTGKITIGPDRDAVKSAVVLQVADGKYIFKEKINP